ncbi:MAG: asparagine synthase (glutamine-hydrolyzing) [Gemmataceae bacterium]
MCGIAGIIDLSGDRRPVPAGAIQAMAAAIVHRGPDEDGFLELPGLAFANRRLSIVGLFDGRQPIRNEDGSVAVVFNGEFFDYPEMRQTLEGRGHRFRTHCDTELIPHLWEDHQERMFDHLRGQFAIALFDTRRRRVVLARDRVGICPLYWTRVRDAGGEWLVFGSEVKAILSSGLVDARPDPQGINHLFTFFSLPGPVTCFEGIRALTPGRYLDIQLPEGHTARVAERTYWQLSFPDQGQEDNRPAKVLADELNDRLMAAVERRLRADVPVVSYLSGGVDSSTVVAMASKIRGTPIPAFTIQIKAPKLDETAEASLVANHIGAHPTVVAVGAEEVLNTYPELIRAAEGPVIDTSCAALLLLAREVHRQGFKVALTGEGADEWLGGYPWHKVNRVLSYLDVLGLPMSQWVRRLGVKLSGSPTFPKQLLLRAQQAVGGHNGWLDIYGLMSLSKLRFFSPAMKQQVMDRVPYEDMDLQIDRAKNWHPFHRELLLSGRIHLVGLLLNAKGDRVAMNSSVETRYPFLDEEVHTFLARVPAKLKLRGLQDKYLLRMVADRWLPRQIAWRHKAMFRAPFDSFHLDVAPPFVEQLLSPAALARTGYFDATAVAHWRQAYRGLRSGSLGRISVEMGLVGVLATQLWHHTFIDGSLADLPSLAGTFHRSGGPRRVAEPAGVA